jgi:hypothetical protein
MGTNKSVVCVYNYDGYYDGVHPNLPMADLFLGFFAELLFLNLKRCYFEVCIVFFQVKRVIIIIAIFWNADWWNACKCYWSVFGFRGAKLEHLLEQRIPIDDWYYHIIVKPGGIIKQIHNEINNSMDSIQEMYGADTKGINVCGTMIQQNSKIQNLISYICALIIIIVWVYWYTT